MRFQISILSRLDSEWHSEEEEYVGLDIIEHSRSMGGEVVMEVADWHVSKGEAVFFSLA